MLNGKYPLNKKMVIGGAVMDSNHNLYFVAEELDDKDNTNQKEEIYTTVYLMSLTEDGVFRWEKQISQTDEYWDHAYITPAISKENIIYVGHDRFYAFNTEGEIISTYPSSSNQKITNYGGAPIIDASGNVYFISPEPINNTSSNQKENFSYFSTDVIKAFKFTPNLGKLIWSTVMGNELMDPQGGYSEGGGHKAGNVESPPAFGKDGKSLYCAVGCTKGVELWSTLIGSDLYNSPILTNQDTIYVGSETNPKGKFHVLDRKTGQELYAIFDDNEKKVPDFTHDAMLLYKGYVYVGVHSNDKADTNGVPNPTFYKIKVDAEEYLQNAAWPRIYGGNSNSGNL